MTDEDIQKIRDSYLQSIAQVTDEAELEALRLSALGKKGEISLKMRELGGDGANPPPNHCPLL